MRYLYLIAVWIVVALVANCGKNPPATVDPLAEQVQGDGAGGSDSAGKPDEPGMPDAKQDPADNAGAKKGKAKGADVSAANKADPDDNDQGKND